jgi:sporadic carbohydrate cluster protein (TIGR04323 family)
MKKLRGYIFSRSFMGERVPQNIQNMALREYCKRKKFHYLLSFSEYAMTDSSAMLYDAINEKDNHGIIAYSIFQLPFDEKKRFNFYELILKLKKMIHFAIEDMHISNHSQVDNVEEIWLIKKTLEMSNNKFEI